MAKYSRENRECCIHLHFASRYLVSDNNWLQNQQRVILYLIVPRSRRPQPLRHGNQNVSSLCPVLWRTVVVAPEFTSMCCRTHHWKKNVRYPRHWFHHSVNMTCPSAQVQNTPRAVSRLQAYTDMRQKTETMQQFFLFIIMHIFLDAFMFVPIDRYKRSRDSAYDSWWEKNSWVHSACFLVR